MEGELSMEVPLNNIYPFRISLLTVKFLKIQNHFVGFCNIISDIGVNFINENYDKMMTKKKQPRMHFDLASKWILIP